MIFVILAFVFFNIISIDSNTKREGKRGSRLILHSSCLTIIDRNLVSHLCTFVDVENLIVMNETVVNVDIILSLTLIIQV